MHSINDLLCQMEVAKALGFSYFQVNRSIHSGFLGILEAPEHLYLSGKRYYTKTAIADYKKRAESFDKEWISDKALRAELKLGSGHWNRGMYVTGLLMGLEIPTNKVFHGRKRFFKRSDVNRWKAEFDHLVSIELNPAAKVT